MGSVPEIRNLEILLEKHLNKKIKIINQQSKQLTAPGENYGSIMAALDVTFEDEDNAKQELHLISKLIPRNEMLREIFRVQETFIKELRVYTKIVPALAQIEEEYGIKNGASDMFAKCYGGRSNLETEEGFVDEDSVLLLENLKISNFETDDRLKGFDFETAEFIVKHLARFHAIPLALKLLKPDIYNEIFDNVTDHAMGTVDKEQMMHFVDGIKEIINVDGKYHKDADKIAENLLYKLTVSFYSTSDIKDPFVSFSHADFWVNNMMLQRGEDGKPLKLIIVDFQSPLNLSVVHDLLFFIYSSVSPNVVYDKDDELIRIYYDSFVDCLKSFNLKLDNYSWDSFTQEIKNKASDILSQILIMYKPILLERGQIENMDTFQAENMFGLHNISDVCKDRMSKTFVQFAEKGWI